MKPASAKQKGRIGQKAVIKLLLDMCSKYGIAMKDDDFVSRSSGSNGEDVMMSPRARAAFPISIECKNIKAFSGKKYYQQASDNAGKHSPVAVIRLPRDKTMYAIISAEELIELYARLMKGD